MKSMRIAFAGVIAATLAVPAHAQERGWVELGAFGRYTAFDQDAGIDNGLGFGGRVGVFMDRRFILEGEGSFTPSISGSRVPSANTNNGDDYNYTPLYLRLTANAPFAANRHAFLVGAGMTRSNFGFTYNYGPNALVGFKFGLGETVALRLDGLVDYLPNFDNGRNQDDGAIHSSLRAGLSFYRRPMNLDAEREELRRRTAALEATEAELTQLRSDRARLDSISAAYQSLRDSMSNTTGAGGANSAMLMEMANAAMGIAVLFDTDEAELDDHSKKVLDAKAPALMANPDMRIRIVGHADYRGSTQYNMQLGMRRAEAARDYLVSKGIDAARIEVVSQGEAMPVDQGRNADALRKNRRGEFEITAGGQMMQQQQQQPTTQPPAQQPQTQTPPATEPTPTPAPTPAPTPSPNPPTL